MSDAPPPKPAETAAFDARLVEVLDQYMADRRSGSPPDHDAILARHPELADELKSCLAGIDLLGQQSESIASRGHIGDFVLGKEIGRGGMGVVYQAHQKSLERTVALKILNLPLNNPKVRERFQREAATAAGLHHTNIVPIYEVGSESGTHYYAMQLIEGSSLAEVMRDSDQSLDLDTIATWGLQAAEALAHAHQHGVIHRDIKPSNLILDQEDRIWLTDFGLARRLDDVRLSATGAVLGTPRYMSPEQASTIAHGVDERTDIYSLGATLYELACGQPAVAGETPVAVINNIMKDRRCSPREHRPAISRDWETILLRCLEKHPTDRYPNAAALASDLRALVEHRPIASRPVSLFEKTRRWFNQHHGSVRIAVAAGIAAIAIIGFGVWFALVYPTLDDASIQLQTTSAGIRADFVRLDGDSDPFLVSVPTTQPVLIDAGQWQARLSQPGRFSQNARHWFEPGDDRGILLPPPPPPLWTAENVINSKVVQFDDGADIVIVTDATIERRDSRSGDVIWSRSHGELPLTSGDRTLGFATQWGMAPEAPPAAFQPAPICSVGEPNSSTADLNGDGQADLLFASHTKPAILALSGADGETLWINHYAKDIGQSINTSGLRCAWVDSGDVTDSLNANSPRMQPRPLAVVTSNRASPPHAWVIQIDGRDGTLLWKSQQGFGQGSFSNRSVTFKFRDDRWHNAARPTPSMPAGYSYVESHHSSRSWLSQCDIAPLLTKSDQQTLCLLDDKITAIDSTDGGSTQRVSLPAAPVNNLQRMSYTDDQGSVQQGYLVACQTKLLNSVTDTEQQTVTLYSGELSKIVWQKRLRTDPGANVWHWTGRPQLPLVVDLNHDGSDEVVVQVDRISFGNSYLIRELLWADVQILSSQGKPLLTTPIRIPTADVQVLHVQPVGDQDGDGWDDLAIASRYKSLRDDQGAVHIDLISSQSASTIWHRKLKHQFRTRNDSPPEIHRLQRQQWNQHDYLVVETICDSGFRDVLQFETTIINPSNGEIVSIGSQLSMESILQQADGSSLIWCRDRSPRTSEQSEAFGQAFRMFRPPTKQTLQVSQHPQFAADLDGDQFTDLRINRVTFGVGSGEGFVSSSTGDVITFPFFAQDGSTVHTIPLHRDLTGNGHDDFLAWHRQETMRLIEGKTCAEKWTLSESLMIEDHSFNAVIPAALTSSESNDLIVATFAEIAEKPTFGLSSSDKPLLVMGVRGSDGKVLWVRDFGRPEQRGGIQLNYDLGDLNGDDRTDIVFGYYHPKQTPTLFAIDGTSGKSIWETANYGANRSENLDQFPRPMLITSLAPDHIAWLRTDMAGKNYMLTIADVVGGHVFNPLPFPSEYANITRHSQEDRWGRHQLIHLKTADPSQQRIAFWMASDNKKIEIHFGDIQSGEFVALGQPLSFADDVNLFEPWKNWFTLLAADTDDDGNEETIFARRDVIEAYQADGTQVWSHPFEGDVAVLESIRHLETTECVATITKKDKSIEVIGIDVHDGSLRWTAQGRPGMQLTIGKDSIRGMADEYSTLPTVVFTDRRHQSWAAIKALPAVGVEFDAALRQDRKPVAEPIVDTRLMGAGPYPGALDVYGSRRYRFPGRFLWSIVWSIFTLMIPAVLLFRVIQKRQFSLSMMLAMTAAVAACFAVLTIPVGSRVVTVSARVGMGFWITPFFIWIAMMVAFYWRKKKWALLALAISPFVLIVLYEVFKLITLDNERIAIGSDILRLWRGLLYTIPIVILICGPIWVPVWFSRSAKLKSH